MPTRAAPEPAIVTLDRCVRVTNADEATVDIPLGLKLRDLRRIMSLDDDADIAAVLGALPEAVSAALDDVDIELIQPAVAAFSAALAAKLGEGQASA